MMQVHGVVLDLDGLLIDSETWAWQAHNSVLSSLGREPLSLEETRRLVGLRHNDEWLALRQMRDLDVSQAQYYRANGDAYYAARDRAFAPMLGVHEFVATAVRLGLHLAIASNSRLQSVSDTLERLGIRACFSALVSGEDLPKGKPAPDVYLKALSLLDLPADDAVAVEDSAVGLQAAVAAGLRCVVVPNELTAPQDFGSAFRRFESLVEVASWLFDVSTVPTSGVAGTPR